MFKFLFLFCCLWLSSALFATPNRAGAAHFRLGPFLEWRATEGTSNFFALRPFFSWEVSPHAASRDVDVDLLWPLTHTAWRGSSFQSRVLIALWHEEHGHGVEKDDYFFTIPPLWIHGRQRGENYAACFPLAGYIPRIFMVEDLRWVGFPLWLHFRTGGSRATPRNYILWPVFSLKHDDDQTRWGLWPLYGTKWEPGVHSRYILWPFWNDVTYDAPQKQGSAWMLWPLMESVKTNQERTVGFIPPFFRYTTMTNGTMNLRSPWPLFEYYRDRNERTWKSWRFWGMTQRGSRHAWWFCYPILRHKGQETASQVVSHTQFWPFYTHDVSYEYDAKGEKQLVSSYFRLWPFYSSKYHEDEGLRRRALELIPVRDTPAIERNLSPFFTFYQATHQPGDKEILHELFWGLIWWHTSIDDAQ